MSTKNQIMNYKRLLTLSMALLITGSAIGQKSLRQARKYTRNGFYVEAAEAYKQTLEKHPGDEKVLTEYADVLFYGLKDYAKAHEVISEVLKNESDTASLFYYTLGVCEHYADNYTTAQKLYKQYLRTLGSDKKDVLEREKVQEYLSNINYSLANPVDELSLENLMVVNLGSHVNSPYDDYVPLVNLEESYLMFTSRRKNELNRVPKAHFDRYMEDMYLAERNGDSFSPAKLLPGDTKTTYPFENTDKHESFISLSQDGNTLYLFKENELYISQLDENQWTEPKKVSDVNIETKAYENHAVISPDGNTIYFTSNREGGQGGLDIYMCQKDGGKWGAPVNLGPTINTEGDEQGPFISADGNTLYYATTGLPGFGGYDIYSTSYENGKWAEPKNLGQPFNSGANDVFFRPNEDASEGFLASDRNGGQGKMDIYRFYYLDRPTFEKEEETIEVVGKPGDSIESLMPEATDNNAVYSFYKINDSEVVSSIDEVNELLKEPGNYKIEIEHVQDCDTCIYKQTQEIAANITIEKDEPLVDDPANGTGEASTAALTLGVDKIYFGFDKYSLTGDAQETLEDIVALLTKHPEAKIAMTGHTDVRGSNDYNILLSKRRANSAYQYLLDNGVDANQIVAREHRGELEPAVKCPETSCSENDHQKNRRVEFQLIQ